MLGETNFFVVHLSCQLLALNMDNPFHFVMVERSAGLKSDKLLGAYNRFKGMGNLLQ